MKMNRHLLGKNLDVFPQTSFFVLHILMINLKIDLTLKSFLVMQFFIYCLKELFLRNFRCSEIVPLDKLDYSGYYFI